MVGGQFVKRPVRVPMETITAEMIARGRFDGRSDERRVMANRLREAREKLSSSGAGNVQFDLELLRLYAEGRLAALLPQIMLSQAIAAMTTLWSLPTPLVLLWLCFTLSAMALACLLARRFLKLDRAELDVRAWYARFVVAEAVQRRGLGLVSRC